MSDPNRPFSTLPARTAPPATVADVPPAAAFHPRRPCTGRLTFAALTSLIALLVAPAGHAEGDRLGGHVGLVFPWAIVQGGTSTELWEFFSMGVPMGITVKDVFGEVAFDFELVPTVDENQNVDVTIHPGLIYPTRFGALGIRAAFVVDGDAVGFTPLWAYPIVKLSDGSSLFFEFDLPVRFPQNGATAVGFATHIGVSF